MKRNRMNTVLEGMIVRTHIDALYGHELGGAAAGREPERVVVLGLAQVARLVDGGERAGAEPVEQRVLGRDARDGGDELCKLLLNLVALVAVAQHDGRLLVRLVVLVVLAVVGDLRLVVVLLVIVWVIV